MPLRLLADENIPALVVEALRLEGHDVVWTASTPSISDIDVLRMAHADTRTLLTFDKDFGELAFRSKLPASSGIILLRLEISSPARAVEAIIAALGSRTDWAGHFSVIENERVRMTPLPDAEPA